MNFVNSRCIDGTYGVYQTDDSIGKAIIQNCYMVLEYLKAETDFDHKEIFVYYIDDLADAMSIEHADIEPSIIDYLKIDNRGNIRRKAEILCTLAKRLEPEERKLTGSEFKSLCEDTTFILNKVARHYQNPGKRIDEKIRQMSDKDIEEWCDRAFNMFLACIAAIPYISVKKDIRELKSDKNMYVGTENG